MTKSCIGKRKKKRHSLLHKLHKIEIILDDDTVKMFEWQSSNSDFEADFETKINIENIKEIHYTRSDGITEMFDPIDENVEHLIGSIIGMGDSYSLYKSGQVMYNHQNVDGWTLTYYFNLYCGKRKSGCYDQNCYMTGIDWHKL